MPKGGKRAGAGRPIGRKDTKTLEREAVQKAFNQRVMAKADSLFNAQLMLAVGSMQVFRIEETREGNKTKRDHVLVTDPDEIKSLLDEHDGTNGLVDGVYYYFTSVSPDNRAIEAMLNRSLGKAVETVVTEVTNINQEDSEERATKVAGKLLQLVKKTG